MGAQRWLQNKVFTPESCRFAKYSLPLHYSLRWEHSTTATLEAGS